LTLYGFAVYYFGVFTFIETKLFTALVQD